MQLVTIKELCSKMSVSHTWIYQQIQSDGFPSPIKLGKNCSRWDIEDVEAWIQAKRSDAKAA